MEDRKKKVNTIWERKKVNVRWEIKKVIGRLERKKVNGMWERQIEEIDGDENRWTWVTKKEGRYERNILGCERKKEQY